MTNSASSMDRISELPTEILHQILSLLPTKTAARTTVLSKPWFKACSTNPNLCFDESDFCKEDHRQESKGRSVQFHGRFVRVVDNNLERYRRENLPISDFNLCISFSDQTDCDGLVDKWLDIIAEKRVSRVALLVKSRYGYCSGRYTLLADTVFAIESLQQLEINQCKILKQKALLSEDKIKCSNLKNLTLCYVTVSESALDSLISCCPKILTISVQYCIGFRCIRVSKILPNLLSLSILSCQIEEVHIVAGAPKMLSFEYVNNSFDKVCLRMLNIGTCPNLRRVEFVEAEIDDTIIFELIPKLYFIKELILNCCKCLNKIKISSSTLEVCNIVKCDLLVQAIFYAPKLLSLVISNQYRLPSLSFESASSKCRISIDYGNIWEAEQCIHLQRSLIELHDQVVDLTVSSINEHLTSTSGIDHLPMPEVDKLILFLDYSTCSPNYFDVIFSICWPKSSALHCDQIFRKFVRRQLLKKRFSKSTWNEYLVNALIEYKKEIDDDWLTLDRKILAADPLIIEEMNTIRLKQNQREEKNEHS